MRKLIYILLFWTTFVHAQRTGGVCPHPKEEVNFYAQVVANGGSLTVVERMAISCYVADLKRYSIWNLCYAVYPMVGSTSNSMSVNLISPSSYGLTFVNTVSGDFTANGWTPNGSTSYANATSFNPASILTLNNTGLEYTSRTSGAAAGAIVEMGCNTSASANISFRIRSTGDVSASRMYDGTNGMINASNTTTNGTFIASRTSSTSHEIFLNGSSIGSNATSGGSLPSQTFILGAISQSGTPGNFTNKQCSNASITQGLTSTQASNFYLSIKRKNDYLSR